MYNECAFHTHTPTYATNLIIELFELFYAHGASYHKKINELIGGDRVDRVMFISIDE